MSDYDFKTLNDKEFEVFCADIIGTVESTRFERFKPGRDAGVDGRYFSAKGEVILQCKHWANTPVKQLIYKLRKDELPKINRLAPAKYFLAVSNPLSRSDKAALFTALQPHIKSPAHIFGKEDLNDLLRDHPEIERKHYKLWLCSASVLQHIINKPIFDRNSFTLEEIIGSAQKYVVTRNHELALSMLENLGVIIITGEPGIGKTTLAEHLCLHYVSNGFTLINIADEIKEAEGVFEVEEKQIFYFDDFLGRNYLEALSGHEGSLIVQFMRRVSQNKLKRFVLTSRSTILNQGKVLIDRFQHASINRNEYELTISNLSEMDRAWILYNHIWHSNLSVGYIDEIYKEKRYKKIINHQNYNPRLISFITDNARLDECEPGDYWEYIQGLMNNPADVWDNPFSVQQDDFGRAIVLLVALNQKPIDQSQLAEAYARFTTLPENNNLNGRKDFLNNLRHLTGSLLNRKVRTHNQVELDLFNPSIGDFVLRRYSQDVPTLKLGFLSLRSNTSLQTLENLAQNNIISHSAFIDLLVAILDFAASQDFVGYRLDYIVKTALKLIAADENVTGKKRELLKSIIVFSSGRDTSLLGPDIAQLYFWALKADEISEDIAKKFVSTACTSGPEYFELVVLSNIIDNLQIKEEEQIALRAQLKACVMENIADNLHENVMEDGLFSDVEYQDYRTAQKKVIGFVESQLEDFSLTFTDEDVHKILSDFDEERALDEYFEGGVDDPSDYRERSFGSYIDQIDDLFDRS